MNKEVEILVVGAGPAGLSAAIEAARYGADVLVVDENSKPAASCSSRSTSSSVPAATMQACAAWISATNCWTKWKSWAWRSC